MSPRQLQYLWRNEAREDAERNLELNLRFAKLTFRCWEGWSATFAMLTTRGCIHFSESHERERAFQYYPRSLQLALRARIFHEIIPPQPQPRHSSLDIGIRAKLLGGDGCGKGLIAYSAQLHRGISHASISSRRKLSQHASSPLAEPRSSFITS